MELDHVKSLVERKDEGLSPKFEYTHHNKTYQDIPLTVKGEDVVFVNNGDIIHVHYSSVNLLEISKTNSSIRNIRFNVLNSNDPVQDCQRCNHVSKCWHASTNNVTLNLLTCRIQYGIKEDNSLKHFFAMIKPKLQKVTKHYSNVVWADFEVYEENIAEMQAAIYDAVKTSYRVSSVLYITPYLFNFPAGVISRWLRNKISASLKYYKAHYLTDTISCDIQETEEMMYDDYIYAVKDLIEDGVTLTTDEYRILKFLMMNAREDRHPLRMCDRLLNYVEATTKLSKIEVRSILKNAKEKLINRIEGNEDE